MSGSSMLQVAPIYCNDVAGMPAHSSPSAQKLLLSLPEILDVDHCRQNTSSMANRDFHWHLVLLSNYMIDVPWLLRSNNCEVALSPGKRGCEKLVVLTGDSDTSGVVDSLGGTWGRNRQDATYTPSIVVGYGSGGVNSAGGMEPTLLVKQESNPVNSQDGSSPSISPYAATRARLAAALGNNNYATVLKSDGNTTSAIKTTCFARVIKPYLPIAYGTHHTKAVLAVNEHGIRVAIFTANFIHDDWNNKNQGIYCEDFPFKTLSSTRNTSTSPMEHDLVRYFSAAGWRDAGRVLSLFDFTSASVSIVASVPGYHQRGGSSIPDTPSGGVLTTWGMWHLQDQLERQRSHFCSLRNKIDLLRNQFPFSVYTATSWNDWASKLWSARHLSHLTWQYSSQGSLTPSFLGILANIMSQSKFMTDDKRDSGLPRNVKVVFPTIEEVRNSVEGWRGGSSIPVPSKNLHASINERLHRFGGGDDDTSHPRRRAMPHIKSYSFCSSFRSSGVNNEDAVTSGLEWFLLTSANLSRAAWGDEQKKASQLMVRSYELGVLYTGGANSTTRPPHTITPWAIGSGYGPAGKRIELDAVSGSENNTPPAYKAITVSFSNKFQASLFSEEGIFLAPIWGLDALSGAVKVVSLVPLPYDPITPQPYSSTVALHLQSELQHANAASSSSSSSPSTHHQKMVRLPDGVSPSAPPAFRQELVMKDVPWVVDSIHSGPDSLGMSDQANRLTHSHYGPQCWSAKTLNFSGSTTRDASMMVVQSSPSSSAASPQPPWRKLATGARRPRSPSGTATDIITISSDDE